MTGRAPFWDQLELEPTADTRTIKLAYTHKLKALDVDADPAGFVALRAARDNALNYAAMRQSRPTAPQPAAQPDPLVVRAEDLAAVLAERQAATTPIQAENAAPSPDPEQEADREQERLLNSQLSHLNERLSALTEPAADAAELISLTQTILANPALEQVDRAAHVEQWMAATAGNAIPRSDPILTTLINHYRWRAQRSAWRQAPAVRAVLARQAQCEFVAEVTLTRHPWRQAYLDLKAPKPSPWRRLDRSHNQAVRLLLSAIVADHPALLRELNQDTVDRRLKRMRRRPLMARFWTWAARYLPGGPRVWDSAPRLRLQPWALALLIALPVFRVWYLLRPGFSLRLRILAFSWLVIWVAIWLTLHP